MSSGLGCAGLRLLLVEDHPVQRRVMASLLAQLGAQAVHEAEDGRKALEVIRDPARPVDIILSDLSMPEMDGMELIRNMAAAGWPMGLAIVSASPPKMLATVEKMARAYGVRMLGTVAKPLDAPKIARLLVSWRSMAEAVRSMQFEPAEIGQAIAGGEIEPFFEPRVELDGARVTAMHVRPQWRHRVRGMLGAAAFMPSVEAAGLADALEWQLLGKAVSQWGSWQKDGFVLDLVLSLGRTSLANDGLPGALRQELTRAGLAPERVIFSIVERSLPPDPATAAAALGRLRSEGYGMAVEDYSAASSWPQVLGAVGFTELLVGLNLVRGLRHDDSSEAGVIVALDVARAHGLASVAEGVRSLDEWNQLQGWGCSYGQGPFVGPALPASDVLPWLRESGGRAHAMGIAGRSLDLRKPLASAPPVEPTASG